MTQIPAQSPVVQVKPQANVYSVLLIVAILALLAAIGFMLWNLLSPVPQGYGMTVEDLFSPFKIPPK